MQEVLAEAIQEERERSEAAVRRAVESTTELVQGRMRDMATVLGMGWVQGMEGVVWGDGTGPSTWDHLAVTGGPLS